MGYYNTLLNQILHLIPKPKIESIIRKYKGDKWQKKMSTEAQLKIMLFSQIAGKDSIRDIETSFNTKKNLFYHLGIRTVAKSTISYKNKHTDYRIFEEIFNLMLEKVSIMTSNRKKKFKFNKKVVSLDSTTIDLCIQSFPWAKYRAKKGAIKIHTGVNNTYDTTIPEIITVSEGKCHDIVFARDMSDKVPEDSILCFDRGYIDFNFFNYLENKNKFFVTRAKENFKFEVIEPHRNTFQYGGILKDILIRPCGINTCQKYNDKLRYIVYYDKKKDKIYNYITNIMTLSAKTVANIYKSRWDIELFFKWIKQNLKIKTFLGTSVNAVMSQIWVVMIYYLLLAYIKFQGRYSYSLLELSRMIKTTIFDRMDLLDLMSLNLENYRKLKFDETQQLLF